MSEGKQDAEELELAPLVNGSTEGKIRFSRSATDDEDRDGDDLDALLDYESGGYERRSTAMERGIIGWRRVSIVIFCVLFLAGTFSRMLVFEEATPSTWTGWQDIRYLFVFGDSYSSIGYTVNGTHPSEENVLGNPPYPGKTTSRGQNWVGYLATQNNESTVIVHDFARHGNTVDGVKDQINLFFLPYAAQKPSWAPWTAENSLFITWVGINDVFNDYFGQHMEGQFKELFAWEEKVYQAGARNFIFFNVPDFERTPCCHNAEYLRVRVREWNTQLTNLTAKFRKSHTNANVAIYNAAAMFNEIMDDPKGYGFRNADELCHEDDCMWADTLHPTWGLHRILAADIARCLKRAQMLVNVLNS